MRITVVQRRKAIRAAVVVSVTLVGGGLAACAPAGSDAGGDVTINVLAEDISYTDNWKDLLPKFEKETGIKVNIETVPYSDQAAKIC